MNRIHFLRACWSDIILVESHGLFGLMDTGYDRDAERIAAYLDSLGVRKLEWILITHFHRDHYGSLPALLGRYPVGMVYMKPFSALNVADSSGRDAGDAYNEAEKAKYEAMCDLARSVSAFTAIRERVDRLRLGDFDFRIFGTEDAIRKMYENPSSPCFHRIRFGENTNSTAFYACLEGTGIYLGGDAENGMLEDPEFDRRNAQYARAVGNHVDLYKVPHHGCGNIFDDEVLSILRPRFSIVTNWGPTLKRRFTANLDRLLAARPDARVLCTDRCGYVFTLLGQGQMTMEEIDRVPEVIPEDAAGDETDAFLEARRRHLQEDGIPEEPQDMEGPPVSLLKLAEKEGDCPVWFVREGKRIGAALLRIQGRAEKRCRILDFWIFAPYRGWGAGHYCFETLEAKLREAGIHSFQVRCRDSAVIRFWKAFGFEEGTEPFLLTLT